MLTLPSFQAMRGIAICIVSAGFFSLGSATAARAQTVVAVVAGSPVTEFEIEQRMKLAALSGKPPSRKEILEELINDRVKLREAKRYGLELSQSEVDSQYEGTAQRMRLTPDQLNKVLEGRGVRPETLKAKLRADFIWTQLVRGRFQQNLTVGEKDVAAALGGDAEKDTNSFEYQMRPVVLIVGRGSSPAAIQERRKEAEALRDRVQGCQQATDMFRLRRDAIVRDTVTKTSGDLPPQLRDILDKTPIGKLTPPEVTRQGIEMVVLCDRKPTTDTPQKREVRNKLFAKKYEAQSKTYLDSLRRGAMIEYRSNVK